jgi:nucleoside-diphosphate-sugar epimerase
MQSTVVLGGNGYLGGRVVRALERLDHIEVRVEMVALAEGPDGSATRLTLEVEDGTTFAGAATAAMVDQWFERPATEGVVVTPESVFDYERLIRDCREIHDGELTVTSRTVDAWEL